MDNAKQYQKSFSERLRALRNEKGLKQAYLAEKLNISNTVVSRLENEGTVPKFDVLIHLSDIFNVSIDYLVGKSDNWEIVQQTPKHKSVVSDKKSVASGRGRDVVNEDIITNYDRFNKIFGNR